MQALSKLCCLEGSAEAPVWLLLDEGKPRMGNFKRQPRDLPLAPPPLLLQERQSPLLAPSESLPGTVRDIWTSGV